jgi:hypothetical protein
MSILIFHLLVILIFLFFSPRMYIYGKVLGSVLCFQVEFQGLTLRMLERNELEKISFMLSAEK